MRRIRSSPWGGQLLQARSGAAVAANTVTRRPFFFTLDTSVRRSQSSLAAEAHDLMDDASLDTSATTTRRSLPSPHPDRALQSAKLAALHARLSLSDKIPLQTLARALVTSSADSNANFNNANLATLGTTLLNYHVIEYLICKWPRLPMPILYEALRAYAGPQALAYIARRWGTEAAAAPGEEVDPGLLQWSPDVNEGSPARWGGYYRPQYSRLGMSRRVVLDDDFGDRVRDPSKEDGAISKQVDVEKLQNEAFASFAQAVIGSIHLHCGREPAKAFIRSHILSRQLDLSSLFAFNLPTRELSNLCAREGFEPPIARLESETGRLSRTPVFVVGIYSGNEKLGEAAGHSLDVARRKASMNALKAWYLYSPGNNVPVPSDTLEEGAKPWKAPYIDIGEVL